jgi:hypothetical protein
MASAFISVIAAVVLVATTVIAAAVSVQRKRGIQNTHHPIDVEVKRKYMEAITNASAANHSHAAETQVRAPETASILGFAGGSQKGK